MCISSFLIHIPQVNLEYGLFDALSLNFEFFLNMWTLVMKNCGASTIFLWYYFEYEHNVIFAILDDGTLYIGLFLTCVRYRLCSACYFFNICFIIQPMQKFCHIGSKYCTSHVYDNYIIYHFIANPFVNFLA